MVRNILTTFGLLVLVTCITLGGSKKKSVYEEPLIDQPGDPYAKFVPVPEPDWSRMSPASVGTYTTLSGFYDYQSNGGSIQQIRIDPSSQAIHVIFMTARDSTAATLNNSRRTVYAYSTNAGASWNNFSRLEVPARRSGFPSLALGQGPYAGVPFIANHNQLTASDPNECFLYADSPPGSGVFAELPAVGRRPTDQPIWPYIDVTANGSIVMGASPNIAGAPESYYSVLPDLFNWTPWTQFPSSAAPQTGGRNPVAANGTGRVGMQVNTSNGSSGVYWIESTNNGTSWPGTSTQVYGLQRVVGTDTLSAYVHSDVVYSGNTPYMVIAEYNSGANVPTANPRIVFWSPTTGFVVAVESDTNRFPIDVTSPTQRFHAYGVGWPSIGLSGSRIVVAFQAFQRDVNPTGPLYQYSDVWFVESGNGGVTWSTPINLTNTQFMDERYPSMAKWNPPGTANMVWTEKPRSGLYAFPGGADTVRASQVYYRHNLTSAGEEETIANTFRLAQNYPNPFNPATSISYTVPSRAQVVLTVSNVLGQEITTLVNDVREAGTYEVSFSADQLPSGVYFYTLRAGEFAQTKKMMLLK